MKKIILILVLALMFNRQINTMLTVDGAFTYYLPAMVKMALGLLVVIFFFRALKAIARLTAKRARKARRKARRARAAQPQVDTADTDDTDDEFDDSGYVPVPYDDDATVEFAAITADQIAPERTTPTYDDEAYFLNAPVSAA